MSTFAQRAMAFNRSLALDVVLPPGIAVMNPFAEGSVALQASDAFYRKFYNDNRPRHLILGINPGRFGAALSGVPLTACPVLKKVDSFRR